MKLRETGESSHLLCEKEVGKGTAYTVRGVRETLISCVLESKGLFRPFQFRAINIGCMSCGQTICGVCQVTCSQALVR